MQERQLERFVPDQVIKPHPDGVPKRKACEGCALRNSNPQKLNDVELEQLWFDLDMGLLEFYCTHEPDGEHHRICGCYAALYRKEKPCPGPPMFADDAAKTS